MSKFYITTSIPYANSAPHIGTALEFLYADVLARFARQSGIKDVLFTTGTDEHGSKIAETAVAKKVTPKQLVDANSKVFKELLTKLDISNNRFIRTTDKGHEQRAQIIWKNLAKDIYKDKYIGLYCVGCEEFVTETYAKENNFVCPNHNRPYDKIEEENYYFALSKYTKPIKKAIEDGSFKIIPDTKKNEILGLLDEGLLDISISRPVEKLTWGIGVPGDKKQVMYVWFEALMNYITVLGYPENPDFAKYWPADVQVVGKDISRFHAAIWPAMLLGLGLELPNTLYVHGFVNVDNKKISKSLGTAISAKDVIDVHGVDALRYYLLRHIPSYGDGDFTWDKFEAAYNNELANELGNAVSRVVAMIEKYQDGIIGEIPESTHDIFQYRDAITSCRFDKALDEVWEQVRGLNQYIDTEKPWVIAKSDDEKHLSEVLAYCVSCILEIADLLEPFLPETALKIQKSFKEGLVVPLAGPLFPKKEA